MEGSGAGMLNKILGEVRDKHGEYGNEEKYGIRKYRRERKYLEGNSKGCERKNAGGGIWSGHAQQDFGRKSAGF